MPGIRALLAALGKRITCNQGGVRVTVNEQGREYEGSQRSSALIRTAASGPACGKCGAPAYFGVPSERCNRMRCAAALGGLGFLNCCSPI